MHIIAEDSQQTSDNCKYRNDLTELLTLESVSVVTKSSKRGTRLSWHINTKIYFNGRNTQILGALGKVGIIFRVLKC